MYHFSIHFPFPGQTKSTADGTKEKTKTAAFEHGVFYLESGMFLLLTTHLRIWKGPEDNRKLILPVVRSDAPNRVSITVEMSHISEAFWLTSVILDFLLFLPCRCDYFKIGNEKKKEICGFRACEDYVYSNHMYYEEAECKSCNC